MHNKVFSYISDKFSDTIKSTQPVIGGDVSYAYQVETNNGRFLVKVNGKPFAMKMFEAEQKGLNAIRNTNTISVPEVYMVDSVDDNALIVMDYIENRRPTPQDYEKFGEELAKLHSVTNDKFGFDFDNFIGGLEQINNKHDSWLEFYWEERLYPQFQMAKKRGLLKNDEIPTKEQTLALLSKFNEDVKPSLLHGDLWGGNYLISTDGDPYLIDPAVYFGHSMVDIAMSRLFGKFGDEFYKSYHSIITMSNNYEDEISLYQLYYLLVHLNLFGKGYYTSVSEILKRYF